MTHLAGNVMQALEDRTEKSRREMDLHDTIDTVRVLNARNQHVDIDKVEGQRTHACARTRTPARTCTHSCTSIRKLDVYTFSFVVCPPSPPHSPPWVTGHCSA